MGAGSIAEVVEREQLNRLIEEYQFSESMLVDQATSAKFGKLLGANAIVFGSIVDVSERVASFNGYGVQTKVRQISATVLVGVQDDAFERHSWDIAKRFPDAS